jgi:hypothetical protein
MYSAGAHNRYTLGTQIAPCLVLFYNQSNLLDPQQALDLLLASDRVADILKPLEVHEAIEFVMRTEARSFTLLMLPDRNKLLVTPV